MGALSLYGPFYETSFQRFKDERRSSLIAKFHKSGLPSHEWSDFVEAEFERYIAELNPHIFQNSPVR